TLAPGTYELRLFDQLFSGRLAVSNPFTVTACTTATLGASPTSVAAGGSGTAAWSGICAPKGPDRDRLYVRGGGDGNDLRGQSAGGAASGSMPFAMPATLAPGTYELRLFAEQFSGRLAVSNTFTVTACTTATLGASPASVPPGTSSITATWSG